MVFHLHWIKNKAKAFERSIHTKQVYSSRQHSWYLFEYKALWLLLSISIVLMECGWLNWINNRSINNKNKQVNKNESLKNSKHISKHLTEPYIQIRTENIFKTHSDGKVQLHTFAIQVSPTNPFCSKRNTERNGLPHCGLSQQCTQ